VGARWPRLSGPDLALAGAGAALTVAAAYASVRMGAQIGIGVLLVVVVYLGTLAGFLTVPHLAVAGTIVLFALIPALKVFAGDWLGSVKDLVTIAAVSAGVLLVAFEHRRPDPRVLVLVGLLLGLYAVNAGGGHGIAWAQGLRLVGEPLLLLLVGLILPQPRRTFRWALGALVLTACVAAAYGLLQQVVGKYTLVSWGYAFNEQVRTFDGRLRSFATFDDPFAYAAYLLFGIAAVMFWLRRGALAGAAAGLMLVGLLFSFVRTSALILVAFGGLLLARRGHLPSGALLMVAAAIAGAPFLLNPGGSETKTYTVRTRHGTQTQAAQTGNLLLNGRVSAWQVALGKDPRQWLFGRGVGQVGTAATRAKYTIAPPTPIAGGTQANQAVDSGYLATVADVGIVGLVVLLSLFARLLLLSGRAAARGSNAGWVALALLVCLMIDALTRASFTGFPTAFLGLFLVGIALASAREEGESGPATATSPAG
jgi:hypothetical protein